MPSRQKQLDLKHAAGGDDGDQGGRKGRGKGKGKGRGRGRGRGGKGGNDDPKPRNQSKRKDESKHDEEDTKRKTKRSKTADPKGGDWNQEWQDHWVEEWGEDWEAQGWNQADKSWGACAWWDGNKSISDLKHETPQAVDANAEQRDNTKKTHSKGKGSTSKTPAASSSGTSPAAKSKPKGKEQAKKNSKVLHKPAAAKPRRTTRTDDKVVAKAAKEKETEQKTNKEIPEEVIYVPVGQKKQVKTMVEFWKRIQNIAPKDQEDTKFAIKTLLLTPTHCSLNIYWSRGSVGVKCCTLKKDFAYFTCTKDNRTWQTRMAIACKAAEIMVPCMQLPVSHFVVLHVRRTVSYTRDATK